jgi:hypothetical protein
MIEPSAVGVEPRAQKALADSPVAALRELRVESIDEGSLLISGSVASFYHKQLAQEVVRAVALGLEVINSVTVKHGSTDE